MAVLHLGPPSPPILLKDPCPYNLSFQKDPVLCFIFKKTLSLKNIILKYTLDHSSLTQIFLEITIRPLPSQENNYK